MSESLRYPIGRFDFDPHAAGRERNTWITEIAQLPSELDEILDGFSDHQLNTPYRPDGWTVRQLVHHVADSHLNAYIRFRLALTEEQPTVKGYDEKRWAELYDSLNAPVAPSLEIIRGLHSRWATLLRSLADDDFQRTLIHPESGVGSIEKYTALYAWHGRHHVAHIRELRQRMKW